MKSFVKAAAVLGLVSWAAAGTPIAASANLAGDDEQIAMNVQSALRSQSPLSDERIQITIQNGIVRLNGGVPSEAAKALAEKTAAGVPGVKRVVNVLRTTSS